MTGRQTCSAPWCKKAPSVQGMAGVVGVTCGDERCIGTPKNKFCPNPDAEAIQIMNGTPGVTVTTNNFNADNFLPLMDNELYIFHPGL